MIKAIIFDLDDTLLWDERSVQEAFKKTCEIANKKYNVDPELLEEKVRQQARKLYATYETYDFTKNIGINPFEGLWGDFDDAGESFQKMKEIVPHYRTNAWTRGLKEVGIEDEAFGYELAETFPVKRKESVFVYEETFTVLDQLKGKYKLALLTNGSPSLQQTKLEITPELVPYFDPIIISGNFGSGKPDPAIFTHALEELDVRANEAIMVGDNLMTDILGASKVEIASVWINHHDKVSDKVKPTYEITRLKEVLPLVNDLSK
ncbi:HAD family hydrolase [Virgibacillus sp. W0430]|uniref:HAD family hydrolase n=1 Tax=Virgibacillus sp. W0430 TaxID=3391580 RepID=UPI003F476A69